ncbi:hypothetical protein MSHI_04000 [Mycobacterium shinjukuense]|uniref:Alpha/beta hydrolase n=2 Tax=Mycobacterium shinjukuense TaxID=398694 RepID=A0A7I7MJI3_9MYCO|nr:hypothetical protein MSHI_04000 [Mycobacterium shinjukuense]
MKALAALDRPSWLPPSAWPWQPCLLSHDRGGVAVTDTGDGPAVLFVHVGSWSIVWAGRHWSRADRAAFRAGVDAPARRAWHAYFRDARRADALYADVDAALRGPLADRPLLTILGQFNDQLRVRLGNHFPMCDDPDLVAGALTSFVQRPT